MINISSVVKGYDTLSQRMDIIDPFFSLSFLFINSSTWLMVNVACGEEKCKFI